MNDENLLEFCSLICARLLIQSIILCFYTSVSFFGSCQNTFKWFQSYLANQKQYVCWRGLSREKYIPLGIPQGSILGPLIFILYINGYSKCLKHYSVTMYADDTSQDVNDESVDVIEKKPQEDLNLGIEWMIKNKLSINL